MLSALKRLFAIALAMMTSRLTQTLNTFIAMAMIAQLGNTVLAAGLTISTTRIVMMLIFMSLLFSTGAITGRLVGEKRHDALPEMLQQGWCIGVLLSIACMIIMALVGPILTLLHQPPMIIPYVTEFFHAFLWAMPAIMMFVVNQQFLAGNGKQHWVTLLSVISLVLGALLNYALIFGHFGCPALGVTGSGLAGTLSCWIGFSISLVMVLVTLTKTQRSQLKQRITHFQHGKLIIKIGTPICIQTSSEMLILMVFILMVGWLGETAMAAGQVANEYMLFAIVPIFGIAEASSICVGKAYGGKDYASVRSVGTAGIILAWLFTLIVAAIFVIFHRPLAGIFISFDQPNAELIYHLALWLLFIRIISMFMDAVSQVLTGSLRGLYDTKFPMKLSMIIGWCIMLPIAAVFGFLFHWGVIGITCAGLINSLIVSTTLWWRWHQQCRNCVGSALNN